METLLLQRNQNETATNISNNKKAEVLPKRDPKKEKVKCVVCKKIYTRGHYKRHFDRQHTDNAKIFPCDSCDKNYTTKQTLKMHVENVHSIIREKKEYSCEKCKKVFLKKPSFYQHMKYAGCDGSKTATCTECKKQFKNELVLKIHMKRSHTESSESLKVCAVCGVTRKSLLSHMKIVHWKAPATCNICKGSFQSFKDLKIHKEKNHYAYKKHICDRCGAVLATRTSLSVHMLTHTGVKNFKCHVCGKVFTQRITLRTHLRVHTNAEPYKCEHCGMGFRWKGTFDNHKSKCKSDKVDEKV